MREDDESYDCKPQVGCPASVEGRRLSGPYREGKTLKGDILVACTNFTAIGDCDAAIAQMRGIIILGANGYSIALNIRRATFLESFWDALTGRGVVNVYFWSKDPDINGSERWGSITLYANSSPTTPAHELGHALGYGHDTINPASVMYQYSVPGRLPYPTDNEIRDLVNSYPPKGN